MSFIEESDNVADGQYVRYSVEQSHESGWLPI
jgi:hypothetical protein